MEDTSICTAETSEVSPHPFTHPSTYSITHPYLCGFQANQDLRQKVLMQYYMWVAIIRDVITVTGRKKIKPDCARGVPSPPSPPPPLCVRGSSMLSYSWITISSSIINEVKLLVAC